MVITDHKKGEARDANVAEAVRRIVLGKRMYDKLESLMKSALLLQCKRKEPFVVILISAAEGYALKSLLVEQKRALDILVEVDAAANCYALMCLDTKVEGGFQFAQRLLRFMKTGFAEEIYMVVADVRSKHHGTSAVLGTLIETYFDAIDAKREGEVILRSFT